jgi:hypothetical protein
MSRSVVHVRIAPELMERLDAQAAEELRSRSQMATVLLTRALDEAEEMEPVVF